jgi:CBS domain-containing protein
MWWPVIGGVVIGIGGQIEPHALGVGYDNIAALLQGSMDQPHALRLLIVKSVIWSIALGSGTSGGVLAPLLMMGGTIGALVGGYLPAGDAGLWALVAMAAMMGGTMRSPLTAIVFAIELTGNFQAILPLAVACAIAHGTTVLLLKRSILTEKVARRGHHIVREYVVDPFESMRVYDIMAKPADVLPGSMPVAEAVSFFTDTAERERHKSYPVVNDKNGLIGMVSRADALAWVVEGWQGGKTLAEAVNGRELVIGYEDEMVGAVADRMAAENVGRVPILQRSDNRVVGLLARRDLLNMRTVLMRHERARETLIRFGRATS